ncbi:hypothetical protein ENUP19_0047G0154 [Entamoeba nuttalli]|uniref:Uncharacterized protein n=2 Tax=Entamoeba nuttalli TaxID=412467 RepID=K2H008_ENTNP|nr:hypothetical protein ENU1_079440 [Entamoeba nuttalli P19]EKE40783.1 hypothetical protein ENU1_079440 [Entamoeba nuttalli P19]|eukprot:XP_008856883.1 hypothetical protein ENU1_079440 [Entamoeba nuttalli P19]
MSDPAVTADILEYIDYVIQQCKDDTHYENIKSYLDHVFKCRDEVKWAEFEYCVLFPFNVLKMNNTKVMIKYPKIGDHSKVKEYLQSLNDGGKNSFERKVLFLPLSVPKYAVIESTEEINKRPEWFSVVDQICVDELPTNKCNIITSFFKNMCPSLEYDSMSYVTLTQKICQEHTDCKKAIDELLKQNSQSLVNMFEIKRNNGKSIKDKYENETTIEEQFEQPLTGPKRERKVCLIRMDYDIVSKGIEQRHLEKKDEENQKDQNNQITSHKLNNSPHQSDFREIPIHVWNQPIINRMAPSLPTREPILRKEQDRMFEQHQSNVFDSVPYSSFAPITNVEQHPFYPLTMEFSTIPSNERQIKDCALLNDYDFKRYYSAQTSQNGVEQLARSHRLESEIMDRRRNRQIETFNSEEKIIDLTQSFQPSLSGILH